MAYYDTHLPVTNLVSLGPVEMLKLDTTGKLT